MLKRAKNYISYIIPWELRKFHSEMSGNLKINLVNGKKVLDAEGCNYSYGPLQKVLKAGLLQVGLDAHIKNILVLGMGGGSVAETIRKDLKSKAYIELVEIDRTVADIAVNEFQIESLGNIKIVLEDAMSYIMKGNSLFDLIIVDLFIKDAIPVQFTHIVFIEALIKRLTEHGKIIYNTMTDTLPEEAFDTVRNTFSHAGLTVMLLEEVESTNDLIIATRD